VQSSNVKQAEAGIIIHNQAKLNGSVIRIQKQLELQHNKISIKVHITNQSNESLQSKYGLEFNFGLLGGDSPDRYYILNDKNAGPLNSHGDDTDIKSLTLVDEWDNFKVNMNFAQSCQLWRAPIETVSMSEAGFERVYQASSVLPHWSFDLQPGEDFKTELVLSIDEFK